MVSVTKVCCWLHCKDGGVLTRQCFVNTVARGCLESSTTAQGSYGDGNQNVRVSESTLTSAERPTEKHSVTHVQIRNEMKYTHMYN